MQKSTKVLLLASILSFLFGFAYSFHVNNPDKSPFNFKKRIAILAPAEFFPSLLISKFESQTNVETTVTTYVTVSEMIEELEKPHDIFIAPSTLVRSLIKKKMLRPLPREIQAISQKIWIDFRRPEYDPNGTYTLPLAWGVNGFLLNKEKWKELPESLKQVVDQKKKLHPMIINQSLEALAFAEKMNALSSEISIDPKDQDLVTRIEQFFESIDFISFNQDPSKYAENAALIQWPTGSVIDQLLKTKKWSYWLPKEGATLWTLDITLRPQSTNLKAASNFIDFLTERSNLQIFLSSTSIASTLTEANHLTISSQQKPQYLRDLQLRKLRIHNFSLDSAISFEQILSYQ